MKTITLRISDVEAAMLNELQLRNQLPRHIAKMFAGLIRSKYDEWHRKGKG
jgi:hypothetical protein